MKMRSLQFAILALGLVGATSGRGALSVTIDQPGPAQVVDISINGGSAVGVWAGIYNLTINSVATPSFCIDVFNDVYVGETFNNYVYTALVNAPLSPGGPMYASHAAAIEELWAAYYSQATVNSQTAAALQVAIWESLGDGTLGYTVTASGNDPVTSQAAGMLNALKNGSLTAQAGLEAIVGDGVGSPGQSYVVVPEPTTVLAGALLLLPLGATTLRFVRKQRAS